MNWKMPLAPKGLVVLWYEGGVRNEERAAAAIVKASSHSTVHLRVFGIDSDFDKECVRHMGDPLAKEYDRFNEGGWDYAGIPLEVLCGETDSVV